jgi:hypothetical protein
MALVTLSKLSAEDGLTVTSDWLIQPAVHSQGPPDVGELEVAGFSDVVLGSP